MVFKINDDVLSKGLQLFNRTEESFREDVTSIKDWFKTQRHLPEIMDDVKISNFLFFNKCSIEKTKKKIDMYYTLRSVVPEFFGSLNPQLPECQQYMDYNYIVFHPKLLDGLYRVFFFKMQVSNKLSLVRATKQLFNAMEIIMNEDCVIDNVLLFDCTNSTMLDLLEFNPMQLKKMLSIAESIYSLRVREVHIFNSVPYISTIIGFLKMLVKQKLFARIHVHQDSEIVKKLFSKNDLPRDYGGDGPSLDELNKILRGKFLNYKDWFDRLDKMQVDESQRPEPLNNDEILGYYGNFKKLNVD